MTKPIEYWYTFLSEDIRKQAMENREKFPLPYTEASNPADALSAGFDWYETPQGREYWLNIFDRAMNGEFNDELLNLIEELGTDQIAELSKIAERGLKAARAIRLISEQEKR